MNNIYPKVGIIVVNYNGYEYTSECIKSLINIEYPEYCIIFIDNGSSDGSGERIKLEYGNKIVSYLLPKNLGVTGGNNKGIKHALEQKLDYVLFLNNDTTVERNFLNLLIQSSLENNNSLVVPKIKCAFDPKRLDHWIGPGFNWKTGLPIGYKYYPEDGANLNIESEAKVSSTCCLLVPLNAIKNIGFMDEKYFMYYDDADFTIRAVNAGFKIIYVPQSCIYHKCNMTSANKQPSFFQYYLINRNLFYFYNKLCSNKFVKYTFFIKRFLVIFSNYAVSLVKLNKKMQKVIVLTLRDIFLNRMGEPEFSNI